MAVPASKRSLLAVWSAIRAAVYPEGERDAAFRRALEQEAQESNARVIRWVVLVAAPLNVVSAVVFLRRPMEDSSSAAWSLWLVGMNLLLAAIGILAAIVSWARRPAALWRSLGDLLGSLWLLGAAARSANAQRVHPNVTLFVVSAFATVSFLRMRPAFFVPALLGSVALVLAAIAHFQPPGTARFADELLLLATSIFSLVGFFLSRSMRVRELGARRQVELLNDELEQRVLAQVGEIVARAKEVEELNTQLNQKIRERSAELSQALARLAEGHGALEPGRVLGGRVLIEAELGRGGMGIVYRGRDLVTDKTVAVKVVQAGSAHELDSLHRFLREARVMASVTHGAIVRSVHVDVAEDGRLFQMMELVDGETLASCLDRCTSLPAPVAARLGAVLAAALAAAHAAGVVHRDVKPSNVMLTRAAPGLKLLDFGVSKLWDARATSHTSDQLLGTPEFLSPEQVLDAANVAPPADVYALGLVLYLCLAGRSPFATDGSQRWQMSHVVTAPVELSRHLPGVDPTLARTVMACLHKPPAERPTASEVADTLSKIADLAGIPPLEALDLIRPAGSTPPRAPIGAIDTMSPPAGATRRSAPPMERRQGKN
jgi:CRP-like cAMP-binding protein